MEEQVQHDLQEDELLPHDVIDGLLVSQEKRQSTMKELLLAFIKTSEMSACAKKTMRVAAISTAYLDGLLNMEDRRIRIDVDMDTLDSIIEHVFAWKKGESSAIGIYCLPDVSRHTPAIFGFCLLEHFDGIDDACTQACDHIRHFKEVYVTALGLPADLVPEHGLTGLKMSIPEQYGKRYIVPFYFQTEW